MKLNGILKDYINHEVVVATREDEYNGTLTDVGEDYIRLFDGNSECIISLAFVESVTKDD